MTIFQYRSDQFNRVLIGAGTIGLAAIAAGAIWGKTVIILDLAVGFNPLGIGAALGGIALFSTIAMKANFKTAWKICLLSATLPVGYILFGLGTVTYPSLAGLKVAGIIATTCSAFIVYPLLRRYAGSAIAFEHPN